MLAGPGQRPGVALCPPRAAHVEVSMHVPATPPAVHGVAPPPPVLPLPPFPPAKASRSASEPLNLSWSELLPTPGTAPWSASCQKRQELQLLDGTLGQVTPQLATHSA